MDSSIENFIGVFPNALPLETCEAFIEDFEENYKLNLHVRRSFYSGKPTSEIDDDCIEYSRPKIDSPWIFTENNQAASFTQSLGSCMRLYEQNFNQFPGIDQAFFTSIKVQRTSPGQGYHIWHCEQASRNSAHRFLFYIAYLNDVEEGGETEFLYYSRRIKPEVGTILIAPASFTHTHRGNPPLSGNKYIATGWVEW